MFLIIAIVFAMATLVFFFVFKIPNAYRVVRGGKISNKAKYNGRAEVMNNKAILKWNTSGLLTNNIYNEEDTILLSEDTIVLDQQIEGFEIEDDIMIVGTNQTI